MMRYAVIENNTVVNIVICEDENLANQQQWVKSDVAEVGNKYISGQFKQHIKTKDVNQIQKEIVSATQLKLDTFANTRNYSNVDSTSKYKGITDEEIALLPLDEQPLVQKFRSECRYLAVIVARTWAKIYLILAEVESGSRPAPSSFTDIEPDLPELVWPN